MKPYISIKAVILEEGLGNLKKEVENEIDTKLNFIKSLKEKELDKKINDRINAEESFCRKVLGHQEALDNLTTVLYDEIFRLQNEVEKYRKSATYWFNENDRQIKENIDYADLTIKKLEQIKANR